MLRKVDLIILHGSPFTGKRDAALNLAPDAYIKEENNRWFGWYNGQKTLILMNFNPHQVPLITLVQVMYGAKMELQGADTDAQWTRVIICTEWPVDEWPYNAVLYFKNRCMYNFNLASERIRFSVEHRDRVVQIPFE